MVSSVLPGTRIDTTRRPGETRSGRAESPEAPHAENQASVSSASDSVVWSSVEPTVITYGSTPGDSTVPLLGPLLPAAATITRPRFQAISTAAAIGSLLYDTSGGAPNDMLTTRMLYCA